MNIKQISKRTMIKIKALSGELNLFLQTPKDYLYSFTYPTDKYVKIKPYRPALQTTADKIINKINKAAPNLKVYFVGSASFHISGQGDIDLIAKSKAKDFYKYLPALIKLFGKPKKQKTKFVEWHFMHGKHKIELILADPSSSNFKQLFTIYVILRKNKKLLKEYEAIKKALNGLSLRDYTKRRMIFFNKILKHN